MSKLLYVAAFSLLASSACAQSWKPDRTVELVVSVAPGGAQDITARFLQRIISEKSLTPSSVVMNKPGGSGQLALAYINQHRADGNYVSVVAPTMITARLTGAAQLSHRDFTAVSMLFTEPVFLSVRADSPLKSVVDIVAKLKADPTAVSLAIATSIGNHIHIGAAKPLKELGVDVKRMKVVAFKSSAESLTALLGGHVDIAASSGSVLAPHFLAGRVRPVAVTSPQRLSGPWSVAPTWKEQGANVVFGGWRGVLGPQGITDAQVAWWEQTIAQVAKTPEWQAELAKNHWSAYPIGGRETRKFWDAQEAELREVLVDLGLAR